MVDYQQEYDNNGLNSEVIKGLISNVKWIMKPATNNETFPHNLKNIIHDKSIGICYSLFTDLSEKNLDQIIEDNPHLGKGGHRQVDYFINKINVGDYFLIGRGDLVSKNGGILYLCKFITNCYFEENFELFGMPSNGGGYYNRPSSSNNNRDCFFHRRKMKVILKFKKKTKLDKRILTTITHFNNHRIIEK